jgi:hypothetical protein
VKYSASYLPRPSRQSNPAPSGQLTRSHRPCLSLAPPAPPPSRPLDLTIFSLFPCYECADMESPRQAPPLSSPLGSLQSRGLQRGASCSCAPALGTARSQLPDANGRCDCRRVRSGRERPWCWRRVPPSSGGGGSTGQTRAPASFVVGGHRQASIRKGADELRCGRIKYLVKSKRIIPQIFGPMRIYGM